MAAKAVKPEPLSGAAPVALGAARSLSPPLVIASRNPFAPANTPNPVDCAQAHLGTLLLAQLQVIGIEARAGKGSVVLALPGWALVSTARG